MKEKILKLGVLIAVLAVVSLAVAGVSAAVTVSTTYYISDDGTDTGNGTETNPIKFFGDEKEINKKIVRAGGIGSVININNSNLNAVTDGIKVETACVINIDPKSNINFGDSEDGKYALFKADYGTNKDTVSDGLK